MTSSEHTVVALSQTVMRAVVASGVVNQSNLDKAVRVLRAEVKAFLFGEEYSSARDCVINRRMSNDWAVGLVIAECVAKIGEA